MDRVLRVTRGPLEGSVYVLGDRTKIGRAVDVHIQLIDPIVSRQHARISKRDDGTWELRDLASKTGTFVDGARVNKHVLEIDEHIEIGDNEFVFEVNESKASLTSSPAFSDKHRGFDALRVTEILPSASRVEHKPQHTPSDVEPYAPGYEADTGDAPPPVQITVTKVPARRARTPSLSSEETTQRRRKRTSTLKRMTAMRESPEGADASQAVPQPARAEAAPRAAMTKRRYGESNAAATPETTRDTQERKPATPRQVSVDPRREPEPEDDAPVSSRRAALGGAFGPDAPEVSPRGADAANEDSGPVIAAVSPSSAHEPATTTRWSKAEIRAQLEEEEIRAREANESEVTARVDEPLCPSPEEFDEEVEEGTMRFKDASKPPPPQPKKRRPTAPPQPGSKGQGAKVSKLAAPSRNTDDFEHALSVLRDVLDYRELRLADLRGSEMTPRAKARFDSLQTRLINTVEDSDLPATRRFQRFACRLPATVTQRDGQRSRTLEVELADLGAGGARITLSDAAIRDGDELWVAFDLAALFSYGQKVVFRSRVIWSRPERGAIGVMFGGNAVFVSSLEDALAKAR